MRAIFIATALLAASAAPALALNCYAPPFPAGSQLSGPTTKVYRFAHNACPSGWAWASPGRDRQFAGDKHIYRSCGCVPAKVVYTPPPPPKKVVKKHCKCE